MAKEGLQDVITSSCFFMLLPEKRPLPQTAPAAKQLPDTALLFCLRGSLRYKRPDPHRLDPIHQEHVPHAAQDLPIRAACIGLYR